MPIAARYLTDPGSRLWPRLVTTNTGCMEWSGSRNEHGYGSLRINHILVKAHRFAWELTYGPIPSGVDVCHRCDNPPCCNPQHLFLGNASDNGQDMATKGRHGAWTQPQRVARGTRHWGAKLDDARVREVRLACQTKESVSSIARRFKVSRATIRSVRDGVNWKHVT